MTIRYTGADVTQLIQAGRAVHAYRPGVIGMLTYKDRPEFHMTAEGFKAVKELAQTPPTIKAISSLNYPWMVEVEIDGCLFFAVFADAEAEQFRAPVQETLPESKEVPAECAR